MPPIVVRVRTRDGTEKVSTSDEATVASLRALLEARFAVPDSDQTLSLDQRLLLAADPSAFTDLANRNASLRSLGIGHGGLVYLRYSVERVVTPTTALDTRPFGAHMTIASMVAKQTRIERQEKPHAAALSIDGHAANAFQAYVNQALAFSLQRGGYLFGEVGEDGVVQAHVVYEPPQQGSVDGVSMSGSEAEERAVAHLVTNLGLQCVGWIFSVSVAAPRDYTLSSKEILHMAELQARYGDFFTTAVVSLVADEEGATSTHFEAFQCSQQCVKLFREGWLVPGEELKFVATSAEKEIVIVAGRDVRQIENEFLITPVPIRDHEGPLATSFPVENRLTGQTSDELRACLQPKGPAAALPFVKRISDFHLLLYISAMLGAEDIALLCEAVRTGGSVSDGHQLLISAIAGLA